MSEGSPTTVFFSVTSKDPIPVLINIAEPVRKQTLDADGNVVVTNVYPGPPVMKEFLFPRFNRGDWKRWRAQIDAERIEQIARGDGERRLTREELARLLLIYPLEPLTHEDLAKRIPTVEGTGHIFATCARRAGVPEHAIVRAVDEGDADEKDMESLALMLASIVDPAEVARREARRRAAQGEGGEATAGGGEGADDLPPRAEDPNDPFTPSSGGLKR